MKLMDNISKIADLLRDTESANEDLLPLIYDELRQMAAAQLSREPAAVGMGATSLVHEAYLRLVDSHGEASFVNQRHFFGAAAEAMRRILIDRARKRSAVKRGGDRKKLDLDVLTLGDPSQIEGHDEILALDEAICDLKEHNEDASELVRLRFYCGCQHQEAAQILGISRRQADGLWTIAKAWLYQQLSELDDSQ